MEPHQKDREKTAIFERACAGCRAVLQINPQNINPRIPYILCPTCGLECMIPQDAIYMAELILKDKCAFKAD